jgi:hypothetical protein
MLLLLALPFGGLFADAVLLSAALAALVIPASTPGYNLIPVIALALAF